MRFAIHMASLMLVAVNVMGAPEPRMREFRLPERDVEELARQVCLTRFDVMQERITARPDRSPERRAISALVECKTHQAYPDYEAYHVASCRREAAWRCDRGQTRIKAKMDKEEVDIGTGGFDAKVAYDLVKKIAAWRNYKGDAAIDIDGKNARCQLLPGPSRELIDITCGKQKVRVSYWCPQSTCPRVFWVNGYFVPADAGGL